MITEQQKCTLPKEEARSLLTDLMHHGIDTFCSELDEHGNLTVIWPALPAERTTDV